MFSKNAAGIALLLVSFFGLFGIEVSLDSATEFVLSVGGAIGFVLMIWNQLGRPDIKGFFFKSKQ
jgi:hypothetical protein